MSKDSFKALGINSSETLVAWAKKHGLLGVFIHFVPAQGFFPGHWQVIRPGYPTASRKGPAWHRGNQTFPCRDGSEKNLMEERAKTWASGVYDTDDWVRIEGMGGDLFPAVVAEELKRYAPEVRVYKRRQKS